MAEPKGGKVWAGIIALVLSVTATIAQFATGFQTLPTNLLDPAFWTEPKHLLLMIPQVFAGLSVFVLITTLFNPSFGKKAGETLAEKAETIHETTVNEGAAGRQRTAQAERAIAGKIEKNQQETNAKFDLLLEQNKGLVEELHISKAVLITIVKRVAPDFDDLDAATLSIRELATLAGSVIDEGTQAHNTDAFVDLVLKRAAEKTQAGDFDGAADETDAAIASWEAKQTEERRKGLALLAASIRQNVLAGRFEKAAEQEWRRIELENPGSGSAELFDAAMARGWKLLEDGERQTGFLDLELALAFAKLAAERAETPEKAALSRNAIGAALSVLGERAGGEEGTKYLRRAVAAFEAALTVRTERDMPANWAGTQNNLGIALQILGQHAGDEVGAKYLRGAVAAYEAALKVYTRDGTLEDWATAQNNLGNTFRILGQRTGGKEGTAYLLRAVAACKAALRVRTEKDMPADWAATQNNLGTALQTLGERAGGEAGAEFLLKAVAACKAALKVRTQRDMPAYWAETQFSLGSIRLTQFREAKDPAEHRDFAQAAITHWQNALDLFGPDYFQAEALQRDIKRLKDWLAANPD
jgi:tetratricopeptide (TPR) repeat protein